MKIPSIILLASASFAFAQTRSVMVDTNGTLAAPQAQAFASANGLPTLSGSNAFAGDNSFSGGFQAGDLHHVEAQDERFSISVNGAASILYANGSTLSSGDGNSLWVIDNGTETYYWTDSWGGGWMGPWATAEEGAAMLRGFLPQIQSSYATSGSGTECIGTVQGTDIPDWSSNSALLAVTIIQQGRAAAWVGAGALVAPSGDITLSGTLTSLANSAPPLLVNDSSAFTNVKENWTAQGFSMAGSSYPLVGMWTSPGQQSMAIGFGGHPATGGDNLGARSWSAVNSSYVGRIMYLGSEGNLNIDSSPASTWQTGNWSLSRGWSFLYSGSVVSGDATPGGFSSRLLVFDGVETSAKNPGAYYWSNHSAVMWNADIGTDKREIRLKFFGSPSSGGYGARAALTTRVIASTEWTSSRWRGTGASEPTTPQDGDLFFNTATSKVRIYAAGSWLDLN